MRKIDYAIIGLCFLAVWATDSRAAEWSEADMARQIVVLATLAADWKQTEHIFDHPELYTEGNPLIKNPAGYFAVCALAATAVVYYMPERLRPIAQTALIVMQSVVITRNAEHGIRTGSSVFVGYTYNF